MRPDREHPVAVSQAVCHITVAGGEEDGKFGLGGGSSTGDRSGDGVVKNDEGLLVFDKAGDSELRGFGVRRFVYGLVEEATGDELDTAVWGLVPDQGLHAPKVFHAAGKGAFLSNASSAPNCC